MDSWLARRWAPWLVWALGSVTVVMGLSQVVSELPVAGTIKANAMASTVGMLHVGWLVIVTLYALLSELGGRQMVPYRTLLIGAFMLWPLVQWLLL